MSETIIGDFPTLSDFQQRMTLSDADALLRVSTGTIAAAARRGEIVTYCLPGKKQQWVTPLTLNDWVANYCRRCPDEV